MNFLLKSPTIQMNLKKTTLKLGPYLFHNLRLALQPAIWDTSLKTSLAKVLSWTQESLLIDCQGDQRGECRFYFLPLRVLITVF
jgi:hypothetical protein